MAGPAFIETNIRLAAMRQIHAAIEHQQRQDYECAITLAAAAEGMLPTTDEPHFHQKVKDFAASLPDTVEGAKKPNDVITWLKHGTYNGKKCETATIDYSESLVVIWRAITKFFASTTTCRRRCNHGRRRFGKKSWLRWRQSKRSPDERSDIGTLSLIPHIAAPIRTTCY
jgi:hypothetical protein